MGGGPIPPVWVRAYGTPRYYIQSYFESRTNKGYYAIYIKTPLKLEGGSHCQVRPTKRLSVMIFQNVVSERRLIRSMLNNPSFCE